MAYQYPNTERVGWADASGNEPSQTHAVMISSP